MSDSFLGLDVGTSGVKAVLVGPTGEVEASAVTSLQMHTPHPGWAEQDPEAWWQASVASIKTVLTARPQARVQSIGISGQMHSSVFLDANGAVIRPALLWCDGRTTAECREITERVGGEERLRDLACNPALEGFTLPKVLWLRNHEPQAFARLATVMLAKDFIRYRLTGAVRDGQLPARRAMRRIIYVECALALAILSVVALWRFTPPPRALISTPAPSTEITAHIHSDAAMADLSLAPSLHAGPATLALYLSNMDSSPLIAQEVDVAFSNPRAGIEPIHFPAHRADDGSWQVSDMELPRQKVWHVRIDALVSDFERISLETTLEFQK